MKNFENIIFDLGGVILNLDYNLTRTAFEDLGVANFDEMYSQANADMLFQKLETGSISNEDFYVALNNCTGLSLSPLQISTAWNAMLLSFREESLQLIHDIKDKYKLFLFSNTNYIHLKAFQKIYHERERDQPFNNYFSKAYYSCEMLARKPDAASFQMILDQENIKAEDTLFIDDSLQNVETAKAMGFQTIHLTDGLYLENLGL
jgi:putative hydrolase of the HAD superfamily